MQVINGYEDFKLAFSKEGIPQNKLKYWMDYHTKYEMIFNTIFKDLYMTDLENVKVMVEGTDFSEIMRKAEKSLEKISIKAIKETIEKCITFFNFQQEFDVYLLVGLGHIDGTALKAGKPFIYLGLERLTNTDVEALIIHEFNHLVRFSTLKEFENLSVGQLVIAEGLATLSPLVVNKLEFSEKNIKKALFVSEREFIEFNQYREKIINRLNNDFDKRLTPALMKKYFMKNEKAELCRSGYFYGVHIIKLLLDYGWKLEDLTVLSSKIILDEYFKTND
ncbi:DUF2268 domain-containing putative Zn-dependent protease [Jeotgalibacillus proteolyticus]|uniref:DUF2268 domain-containing protein n=1 Tax=Jeotgalibacillus proteolyticus TaxID=2082395 RepID=A0A2S5G967_9BACL|nr:DUF2268 domain-containing putative Zn-dependent protease [Jeotgalibacillus proteolyticus]PPA69536.1 hypothetical protein C4B60_13385 [Jeotgalibacillus proteolyticus]